MMTWIRAALLGALLAGCGGDTLLIVSVSGAPPGVERLRATVTLEDARIGVPKDIHDLEEFALLLQAGASGRFLLAADGLDGAACVVARGRTDTTLRGGSRVRLSLPLGAVTPPVFRQG